MGNLLILHEIDKSIISIIKEFSHAANFSELSRIVEKLSIVEKDTNNEYPNVEITNIDILNFFEKQNIIRKEINDILDQFNSQKSNRKSIINNKIEPIINDYITNYNIILELLRNENLIKSKKDTI